MDRWSVGILGAACASYALLLSSYATPPVLREAHFDAVFKAKPRVLVDGMALDGLAWVDDHLIFAEPSRNRLWRHEFGSGLVRVGHSLFLKAVCDCDVGAVGLASANGSLLLCELGSKALTRLDPDGTRTVLASDLTPNAVATNGTVFYTDLGKGVFELADGRLVAPLDQPEGLAIHEAVLYVADVATRAIYAVHDTPHLLYSWERPFHGPTGLAVDKKGRLFATSPDGVDVLQHDGRRLATLHLPEPALDLAISSDAHLYIATPSALLVAPLR